MKRILQNLDKASTRVVEGADDMRRFVSAVRALNAPINEQPAAAPAAKPAGKDESPFDNPNFKPTLQIPQVPVLPNTPLQPGANDMGDGIKIDLKPDGTKTHSSGSGTFTFDKNNKPIKYQSPSFSGLSQTHDLVTGKITVRYMAGPMDVSQEFDKTGKRTGTDKAEYDLGLGVMSHERNKGITATTWKDRGNNVIQSRDMVKDPAVYDRAMAQVNKPTEGQYMSENTLRKYLDIVERMPLPKMGADGQPDPADMEKLQTAMDQKQKISQQLSAQPQSIRQLTGKIDYTKEGPKTKSSQGVDLEYGIPVKDNKFMNPQKLPNWDAHGDDEQFQILQAYKAWLRDYTSRWPEAQQQPDGTWRPTKPGLAPMTPKFENANFKDYLQMVEEGLKDPKDNPCWKGYKPVGTKKKNGKTVPNCVPKE